jgi:hypothetical protein
LAGRCKEEENMIIFLAFWLFTIFYIAPCWILVTRAGASPAKYHWLIPIWNLFVAYRVGKGSLLLLALSVVVLIILASGFAYMPGVAMGLLMAAGSGGGVASLLSGTVIGLLSLAFLYYGINILIFWKWAKNISKMSGSDPKVLGAITIAPIVLPVLGNIGWVLGFISVEFSSAVSLLSFAGAWCMFMIIALRTSRVIEQPEELKVPAAT